MKICLKTEAKKAGTQHVDVNLQERLPKHLHSSPQLSCDYKVELSDNYYLLSMSVKGELDICCQRCLGVFRHNYTNVAKLAICADDTVAQTLMEQYECVVASNNQIDLIEILTDELYLFTPEKHLQEAECDSEIEQLICD